MFDQNRSLRRAMHDCIICYCTTYLRDCVMKVQDMNVDEVQDIIDCATSNKFLFNVYVFIVS